MRSKGTENSLQTVKKKLSFKNIYMQKEVFYLRSLFNYKHNKTSWKSQIFTNNFNVDDFGINDRLDGTDYKTCSQLDLRVVFQNHLASLIKEYHQYY